MTMNLLVRGLRSKRHASHKGSVHSAHYKHWCVLVTKAMNLLVRRLRSKCHEQWVLVTRAIQGKWSLPTPSRWTRDAENGLGIHNKPYYFYALRAEEPYGLAVFILREVEDLDWPECARGATPFDSGVWFDWLRKIDSPPDQTETQEAFQRLDVPLSKWQVAFEQYILLNCGTVGNYIKGCVPGTENQPRGIESTSTARACAWEVRVPHDLIAGRLALSKVYMTESSLVDYKDWLVWQQTACRLRRQSLDNGSYRRIQEWIEANVVTVPRGKAVVLAVNEAIEREVGNG